MKKINFSVTALLRNNRFVFAFSLIAAIAIWISVSPTRKLKIPVTVNIATENTAGNLGLQIIEGQGQSVDVEVEGKWYVLSKLTEKDIKITIAMNDVIKAGEYELRLSAQKNSATADFNIVRVVPEKIKVKFDYTYPRAFKIETKVNGVKAAAGLIADTPVLDVTDGIINITGPKSIVETISSVVAEVDVNATLSSSTSYTTKLKILDENGNSVDTSKLTLPFDEVSVTVPINKAKTIPVVAAFSNKPEAYKSNNIAYTLSVSKVDVVGPAEVIDSLSEVTLDEINFKDISPSTNTFTYSLNLPSGVKVTNDVDQIVVKIDTSDISSKTLDISKFIAVNQTPGKTVSVVTGKKTVTIAGQSDAISKISASDLYLEYDMSTVEGSSGEHIITATVKSSTYKNIWGVGDYQIQINVE